MSERPGYLLRRLESRPPVQEQESGLTPLQLVQMERVTSRYLRENGLLPSINNMRRVQPVIRVCIQEGLKASRGRSGIQPRDDLGQAFKHGYDERKKLIRRVRLEISGETDLFSRPVGRYALPLEDVRKAKEELAHAMTRPYLPACHALADRMMIRQGIFRRLITFTRNIVETKNPESRSVVLTRSQEVSLVHNAVFSYAVDGQIRPILNAGDILHGRAAFLDVVEHGDQDVWSRFAKTLGVPQGEASLFFQQIAIQVAPVLRSLRHVDPKELFPDRLEGAHEAFRLLEPHFLLTNPFSMIALSEDLHSDGVTIWDREYATVQVVNGVAYRIPQPWALRLLAEKLILNDRDRSEELRRAATTVEQLSDDIRKTIRDTTPQVLDAKISRQDHRIAQFIEDIKEGRFPQDLLLPRERIDALVQEQREVMRDELDAFDIIREYLARKRDCALEMVEKYTDGRQVEPQDIDTFRDLFSMFTAVKHRASWLLNGRLIKRIQALARLPLADDFFMFIQQIGYDEPRPDRLPPRTVIDIYAARNRFWVDRFLGREPLGHDKRHLFAWRKCVAQWIAGVDLKVEERAWKRADIQSGISYAESRKIVDAYVREHQTALLGGRYSKEYREYQKLKKWQSMLERGEIPKDKALRARARQWWERERQRVLRQAAHVWEEKDESFRTPIVSPWEKRKERAQKGKVKMDVQDSKRFLNMLYARQGPLKIAIRAYALTNPLNIRFRHRSLLQLANKEPVPESPPLLDFSRAIRDQFCQHLAQCGYRGNIETLHTLLSSGIIPEMRDAIFLQSQIFGIEQEVSSWYKQVDRNLQKQYEMYDVFLSRPPEEIYSRWKKILEQVRRRRVQFRRDQRNRFDRRIRELRALHVILPNEVVERLQSGKYPQ